VASSWTSGRWRTAWVGCASSDSSPRRSVKGRGLCELPENTHSTHSGE
jgi:hypothetical protein